MNIQNIVIGCLEILMTLAAAWFIWRIVPVLYNLTFGWGYFEQMVPYLNDMYGEMYTINRYVKGYWEAGGTAAYSYKLTAPYVDDAGGLTPAGEGLLILAEIEYGKRRVRFDADIVGLVIAFNKGKNK